MPYSIPFLSPSDWSKILTSIDPLFDPSILPRTDTTDFDNA